MTIVEGGKYRKFKSKKPQFCECTTNIDYTSSQPRINKCGNVAEYVWFSRNWFLEIKLKSVKPLYFDFGALACESCLEKLKTTKPPSDLEKFKAK